jgi:NAD(P)-dependent dehydrogenase (short-subunit alcohol dehydrogenase family)
MRLLNRIALITGAGSGKGRASALLFSKEGAKIAVVDVDEKGGQQTVDSIRQKASSAIFIPSDVSKAEDVERIIKTTVDRLGKLDILFNNSGMFLIPELFRDLKMYSPYISTGILLVVYLLPQGLASLPQFIGLGFGRWRRMKPAHSMS